MSETTWTEFIFQVLQRSPFKIWKVPEEAYVECLESIEKQSRSLFSLPVSVAFIATDIIGKLLRRYSKGVQWRRIKLLFWGCRQLVALTCGYGRMSSDIPWSLTWNFIVCLLFWYIGAGRCTLAATQYTIEGWNFKHFLLPFTTSPTKSTIHGNSLLGRSKILEETPSIFWSVAGGSAEVFWAPLRRGLLTFQDTPEPVRIWTLEKMTIVSLACRILHNSIRCVHPHLPVVDSTYCAIRVNDVLRWCEV